MSQPPHGEDPQDPRVPGWGQPDQQFDGRQAHDQAGSGGWGPPSPPEGQPNGWGPPSGTPYQGGWGQQAGQYGGYGQPYGAPQQYGRPDRYGAPPGQYGGLPPYGQPGQYGGWEQPPPPPRRKRRFGLLFWLLVLVLLVGLVFTLPARLGSTRLDPDAVQRDVAAQFQEREGRGLDLRCGEEMIVEAGRSYQCEGTTPDGSTRTFTITITNADGDYTWSDR